MKILFLLLLTGAAWGQSVWSSGSSTSGAFVSTTGIACGPPAYLCARTDRVLTILPSVPPQAGANACSGGQSLPNCGNLLGVNTVMSDALYNRVRILRATDYNDETNCPGPSMGPGGSAEENVWSKDDQLFILNCSNGGVRVKAFNAAGFQVGNYATSAGALWKLPGGGEFSYVTPDVVYLWVNAQVQMFGLAVTYPNAQVVSGPTVVADFSYAMPCWQNNGTPACPDWTSGTVQPGTTIFPLSNNPASHVFQVMNTSACANSGAYPGFNSTSTSELAMIADGLCNWLDIGPRNTVTWQADGGVATDDQKWSAALANYQGQGGNGAMFVVQYNALSHAYYHLNTATGNAYTMTCVGGTGYNCAGGTFTQTYLGNLIPATKDLVLLHNTKTGKDGTWLTVGAQKCAFTTIQCAIAGGGPAFFWRVGTTTVTFFGDTGATSPGHHASGYRTLVGEYGNAGQYFHAVNVPSLSVANLFDTTIGPACSPTACPKGPPFDQHISWVADDLTDTAPVCGAALAHDYGQWPPAYPWQEEVFCFATDGTNTVWRQGYTYNTGGSQVFAGSESIGSLSQSGKFWGQTSDWWDTLGSTSGTSQCLGGFNWQPSHTYNLNDLISPATNNGPVDGSAVYQATACTGACTTSTSHPAFCGGSGCTVIDGNVTWTNKGASTCRADVMIYQLQ